MAKRFFEDFEIGEILDLAQRRVERADIIAFAAEFDPQPFHLDERTTPTDLTAGLSASGWHTCAMFMRMLCDGYLLETSCMGSPGIETLKWRRPVRPGDLLSGTSTVIELRESKSRPTIGIIRFRHEVTNQSGEVVMWMENPVMFERRAAA
ncbi:MAG: MaoC family dehydratase [Bauldia sp.]|uniref:MaoC family dehydratase n=1 Tax=Bauldia sp. TaxID=2575872 RepID=UPI001DBB0056|nr:MaoC family dehydratase [Bauldia sp.]MCB1498129.1 MaoC family dehydratase [Bauldia sp.]